MPSHWILKTEPSQYSWEDLLREKKTSWDGVRNYQARNHIGAMRVGDVALIYHSVKEKRIVGISTILSGPYPDPTAKDKRWLAVDLEPLKAIRFPVSLSRLKSDPELKGLTMVRSPRVSVTPVPETQFQRILYLGRTQI